MLETAGSAAVIAAAAGGAVAAAAGADTDQQISTALVSALGALVVFVVWLLRRLEARADKEGDKADKAQAETNRVLTEQVATLTAANKELNEEVRRLQAQMIEKSKGSDE